MTASTWLHFSWTRPLTRLTLWTLSWTICNVDASCNTALENCLKRLSFCMVNKFLFAQRGTKKKHFNPFNRNRRRCKSSFVTFCVSVAAGCSYIETSYFCFSLLNYNSFAIKSLIYSTVLLLTPLMPLSPYAWYLDASLDGFYIVVKKQAKGRCSKG